MLTARRLRPLLAAAGLAGLVIYAAAPAGGATTAPASHRQAVHTHPDIFVSGESTTGSTSHSNNWAGYAALPEHSGGSFRFVQATFTVPSINCAATPNAFSVHWVGLDGFATSTVQQDGIEANCNGITPVYSAWWETYPANQNPDGLGSQHQPWRRGYRIGVLQRRGWSPPQQVQLRPY